MVQRRIHYSVNRLPTVQKHKTFFELDRFSKLYWAVDNNTNLINNEKIKTLHCLKIVIYTAIQC